jgi:hypothetical protein
MSKPIPSLWILDLYSAGAPDEVLDWVAAGSMSRRMLMSYARMFGRRPRWWWTRTRLGRIYWRGLIGDGAGLPPRGAIPLRQGQLAP